MKPAERAMRTPRGLTLIELVVVIAVMGVIVALAAPSFTSMIQMQRLRGVNAQLLTDIQFARSEAISRNTVMRVDFRNSATQSCYTLYTAPLVQGPQGPCNCQEGAGNACAGMTDRDEVRTVQVPAGSGVTIRPLDPPAQLMTSFGFDPATGGLVSNPNDDGPSSVDEFKVDVYLDSGRKLQTWVERSGRPTICKPPGSTMPEPACR